MLEVWLCPAEIARALPKNDSATTWLFNMAELFDGFGSWRALEVEKLCGNAVPGAASALTVRMKRMPESIVVGWSVLIRPVTVPPEFVHVPLEWLVLQLMKLVPAGRTVVITTRSAGFGPWFVTWI